MKMKSAGKQKEQKERRMDCVWYVWKIERNIAGYQETGRLWPLGGS